MKPPDHVCHDRRAHSGASRALFIDDIGRVAAYRYATYAGLSLWFLSLIPALMLREYEANERPGERKSRLGPRLAGLKSIFAGISRPRRIAYFVLTSAILSFTLSVVAPL